MFLQNLVHTASQPRRLTSTSPPLLGPQSQCPFVFLRAEDQQHVLNYLRRLQVPDTRTFVLSFIISPREGRRLHKTAERSGPQATTERKRPKRSRSHAVLTGRAPSSTTSSPYDCEWTSRSVRGGEEEGCPRAFHSQSSVVPPRREAPRLPSLPPPPPPRRSLPSKWVNVKRKRV